ncbi:hypothetical protein An07g01590 [Aspergillus niger]|uniref:Uncharacterized protein n=2 Tax=Aspergillus niger TaxID=5061 RepID=A2QMC3_ASPNC|nr:hypothetical protein An07g01590 [Aspergillus niger]CAK96604.1 hypothetical protein An07g01590 [Aspergillus niger]
MVVRHDGGMLVGHWLLGDGYLTSPHGHRFGIPIVHDIQYNWAGVQGREPAGLMRGLALPQARVPRVLKRPHHIVYG